MERGSADSVKGEVLEIYMGEGNFSLGSFKVSDGTVEPLDRIVRGPSLRRHTGVFLL